MQPNCIFCIHLMNADSVHKNAAASFRVKLVTDMKNKNYASFSKVIQLQVQFKWVHIETNMRFIAIAIRTTQFDWCEKPKCVTLIPRKWKIFFCFSLNSLQNIRAHHSSIMRFENGEKWSRCA